MANIDNPTFTPMQAAGVDAAAGVGGALVSGGINALLAKQQYNLNNKLMDKQNEWSLEMWNKQNEYNTPEAQAERLRDAGLNPLFAGLDGTGNAAQLQSATSSVGLPQVSNPGPTHFTDASIMDSQKRLAEAQAAKVEKEAKFQDMLNEIKAKTMGNEVTLSGIQVELAEGEKEVQQKTIARIQVETDKLKQDVSNSIRSLDQKDQEIALQKAEQALRKWMKEQDLTIEQKKIAIAWFEATTNRNMQEQHSLLEGEQAAESRNRQRGQEIQNDREEAQLEADKPVMKFRAYADLALDCINGAATVVTSAIKASAAASVATSQRNQSEKALSDARAKGVEAGLKSANQGYGPNGTIYNPYNNSFVNP